MRQPLSPDEEQKKRRRELYVALFAALLVGALFLAESYMVRSAEDIPFAGHLLLFGLLSVVTLLLIVIIFFLIRNLFKLVFERRRRVLGSHLKTRLTSAFVALTLVPTVVLFIASAGVLHTTIESWFKAQVEESLQSSLVVAQAFYQTASEKVLNTGARLSAFIHDNDLLSPAERTKLVRAMDAWRAAEGISSIQLYFSDGANPVLLKDPALKDVPIPPPVPSFLKIAFQGDATSKIMPLDGGSDLIQGLAPIKESNGERISAVLVIDYFIPNSLAGRLFSISSAFGDYQEAKRMKGPVKTMYVLILLMVALLAIFIGFWFGATMARDITDPIQRLAEGTQKIAQGDLNVHIDSAADDELGILVQSFNKMTDDLRENRDELVRVNTDLESRRKYTETVLKNIAAGVVSLDSEARITTANNSARRLLGIAARDIVNRPCVEVLPDASAGAITSILEDVADSDSEALERQITLSFPERVNSLICFANKLRDEEGNNLGFVLVFEDMTYLVKAQRMAAWREVARRIAHEIKNPLTPIQLNAQRLRRKYMPVLAEDGAILDQCTGAIIDQVEQLKHMVNEFSQFARMPAANPVPNDLNAMISEVVNLYYQANDQVNFVFRPDRLVPIFNMDKEQMKRAVVNLLDNAVSAIEKKGIVEIITSYDQDLAIASIEVADNGAGVNPHDRDRLFEPYFSRKPGGTGLGLTIVSTIVSDHNGFIRVKDNPGGGARFILELPVRKT